MIFGKRRLVRDSGSSVLNKLVSEVSVGCGIGRWLICAFGISGNPGYYLGSRKNP